MTLETGQTDGRISRRTLLGPVFSGVSVFLIAGLYVLADAEGMPAEYTSIAVVLLCIVAFPAILLLMLLGSLFDVFNWPDAILDIEAIMFLVIPSSCFWWLAGWWIGRGIDRRRDDAAVGPDESD